ncbi:MAG: sensor histidine kinase [Candidatus Riflebacteria bacterium]|nr:sensor histidine kinase [Candidatus Riflebacteria bacterium]
MGSALRDHVLSRTLSLKSSMESLTELVENWICTLFHEEDRLKKLNELVSIIQDTEGVFTKSAREECLKRLDSLIGAGNAASYASSSFRLRLQGLLRELMERLNREIFEMENFVRNIPDIKGASNDPAIGLILAQENERKRISREIHDGPAQHLASLTMRIDFCLERINDKDLLNTELLDLKDSIIRSLKDIRRFIFDLRPMALDDLGLVPTLEQFISGFHNRAGIAVHFHRSGESFRLQVEKELAIFRVIQEAVGNATRHSDGKSIRVFLAFDTQKMCVNASVEDDGKGFDIFETKKNYATLKKMGLLTMEERIRLSGGNFVIESWPGKGCKISFSVPK